MFKGQPKGLIGAALANMGERFGFYVMMAILVLFLQAKFGLDGTTAGLIYSIFYASIYVLALVGGIVADKTKKYKETILAGLLLMGIGYVLIGIPTPTPTENSETSKGLLLALTCLGLFVIAFGNGLFKGNLQAVVGQLYDDPKYSHKRDSGFQVFYMFINVGAMFAPLIAMGVRNIWLKSQGFIYDAKLPELCHDLLKGNIQTPEAIAQFTSQATSATVNGSVPTDLAVFATEYLGVFNTGFHFAFLSAVVAMLISLAIWMLNRKSLPDPALKAAAAAASGVEEVKMAASEVRQRLYALFAVFGVVIFFWFSFHQNGLTLTMFARDYTNLSWELPIFGQVNVGAEIFQSFNPFFVVFLTPIIIAIFGWLNARGKEPSTPRKIAIGMFIAAIGFVVMTVGCMGLPTLEATKGGEAFDLVSPWLLIGTYFILTCAELFISPLGLSFVSKVAPPHLQGIMQGMWLTATAVGNSLLFIGAYFYESITMSGTWSIFAIACLASMCVMLGMVKWLERVAK